MVPSYRRLLALITLFLSVVVAASVQAEEFRDWHDADLIFQNSGSGQTNAILQATGSRYTHVGIIKLTPKGPVVVEAVGPVKETPLATFIRRGEGGAYAVFRVRGLSREQAARILQEARKYYGRPYDPFFRLDSERIYCSELIWLVFPAAGVRIGTAVPFGALNIDNAAVRQLFLARWKGHPDCRLAGSPEVCWATILKQKIVTPASLVSDSGKVQRLFPR